MCGIAGIKRMGTDPITPEEIKILLCSLEHRGSHATGIAIETNGEIAVLKKDVPAWSFTASEACATFLRDFLHDDTNTVLLHTRAATKGAPYKNDNNHPIFRDNVAIVHNGGIRNDDTLFKDMSLERNCETDSDIIRGILDSNGLTHKGVRELNKMQGSAAIAAVKTGEPGSLFLARSGNPIILGSTETKFYWASELSAIQKAVRPWVKRFGIWMRGMTSRDVTYQPMPDHTAYLIGPEGLRWKQEFSICQTFVPAAYNMHSSYNSKQNMWQAQKKSDELQKNSKTVTILTTDKNEEKQEVTVCRRCKKGIAKKDPKEAWSKYICWNCDETLAYLEAV